MNPRERALLSAGAAELAVELAEIDDVRPRTRGDCANGPRPCPWVGCRHHLYLEVNPATGTIKLVRPDLEPLEMAGDTCSLDVADDGAHTLEQVGIKLNVTRERLRQLEVVALHRLKSARVIRDAGPGPFAPDREPTL